jgi:hypothetical protein
MPGGLNSSSKAGRPSGLYCIRKPAFDSCSETSTCVPLSSSLLMMTPWWAKGMWLGSIKFSSSMSQLTGISRWNQCL